jgi:hypothetical protein
LGYSFFVPPPNIIYKFFLILSLLGSWATYIFTFLLSWTIG